MIEFILYIIKEAIFVTGILVWLLIIWFFIANRLPPNRCNYDCNQGRNCKCGDKL